MKLWEHDSAFGCCRIYATADFIAWDIVRLLDGSILRQGHIRKASAAKLFTAPNQVRYYTSPTPTNAVLLNATIQPADLADGTQIKQIGVFVKAAGEVSSPGAETVAMDDVSEPGVPVCFEDGVGLVHTVAAAVSLTPSKRIYVYFVPCRKCYPEHGIERPTGKLPSANPRCCRWSL